MLFRSTLERLKRFEFVEREPPEAFPIEPGLKEFLKDSSLRGDATEDKLRFLKGLKLSGRRPTPLYYYRELQNLRGPLHFGAPQRTKARLRGAPK